MDIKINTNISSEYPDIQITINAPSLDKQTQMIIDTISKISKEKNQIIGESNNNIFILPLEDILCFYADDKYNYCKANKNSYKIKYTLYELEETLNRKDWIRVSHSCILNVNHIKCFDIGTVGSIVVILDDDSKYDVSKRKIKDIMKFLKERRL